MVDDVPAHLQRKTVEEDIYYPEHEPRKASSLYRHNHALLVHHLKEGCWICGTREKLETHHWHEWAEWQDLDPAKVRAALLQLDFYGFSRRMADEPVVSPDDVRNLVVLCADHHRHREKGVHDLTFPIWLAQRAVLPGRFITEEANG